MKSILIFFTHSTTSFIHFLRIAIFIVTAWIGGLKVFPYEADGIVPFVINSPFMSFFFEKVEAINGVQIGPGATAFTRISFSAKFAARLRVKESTAPLVAA